MLEADAVAVARALMDEHGLSAWDVVVLDNLIDQQGYHFVGRCLAPLNWILLARPYLECNQAWGVREIVLHEIAHAFTEGHGHDGVWAAACRKLGGSGEEHPKILLPGEVRLMEIVMAIKQATEPQPLG